MAGFLATLWRSQPSCLWKFSIPRHLPDLHGDPTERQETCWPIGMPVTGGGEAYPVDHGPIWQLSAPARKSGHVFGRRPDRPAARPNGPVEHSPGLRPKADALGREPDQPMRPEGSREPA